MTFFLLRMRELSMVLYCACKVENNQTIKMNDVNEKGTITLNLKFEALKASFKFKH
jgi:HD superfamily phosphohydrolase YqeK